MLSINFMFPDGHKVRDHHSKSMEMQLEVIALPSIVFQGQSYLQKQFIITIYFSCLLLLSRAIASMLFITILVLLDNKIN